MSTITDQQTIGEIANWTTEGPVKKWAESNLFDINVSRRAAICSAVCLIFFATVMAFHTFGIPALVGCPITLCTTHAQIIGTIIVVSIFTLAAITIPSIILYKMRQKLREQHDVGQLFTKAEEEVERRQTELQTQQKDLQTEKNSPHLITS